MSYYVKVALITLLVSVAAAEIFGPMAGLHGYIRPAVMSMLDSESGSAGQEARSPLALAENSSSGSEVVSESSIPSAARPLTADEALDSCMSALKSVSLYPESARIPDATPQIDNGIFTFEWSGSNPTRLMDTAGREQAASATCRIGEDGRFRNLVVGGNTLFDDPLGRGSVLGDWRVGRTVSRVDNSTNVTVSKRVDNPVVINGQQLSPTLVMHCGENKTVSYVKLGVNIGSGRIPVTTSIDGEQQEQRWSVSSDGENIYQGSQYITLLRQLADSSVYSLRLSPSGQEAVTLEFNLDGIKAALNPLQEACHWR